MNRIVRLLCVTLFLQLFYLSAYSQILFSEDFDGIDGPTAGGAGTYAFPAGWFLRNVDNRTPDAQVAYVNQAWERREDFNFNVTDSCAFSTSYYSPVGPADDWMWTPLINLAGFSNGLRLRWNAVTYDGSFRDGYEVRIMVGGPPTGGTGTIGNQVSNSTVVFSTAAENTTWTARQVDLSAYAGQAIYIGFRNNSNDKFLLLIDDIVVERVLDWDANIISHVRPTDYSKIPLVMTPSITFGGRIRNDGISPITNVRLTATVFNSANTQVYTNTSAPVASLAAGAFSDFTVPPFTPTLPDDYRIEYTTAINETDQDPANNLRTDGFNISTGVYARDTGSITGQLGIGAYPSVPGYLGQHFVITNTSTLNSVSIYLTNVTPPMRMGMAVYDFENGRPTTLLYNAPVINPTASGAWYTFPVLPGTGLPLFASDTIVVTAVEIDSTLSIGQTNNIYTPGSTWINWPTNPFVNWANNEQFGPQFTKPYMIRANFGGTCATPPTVDPSSNQSLCNGVATAPVAFTGSANTSFYWTNSHPSIGLGGSGTGNIPSFNTVNTTNSPIIATITVTPIDNTTFCSGTPQTFTITVNPAPAASGIANQQLCAGDNTTAVVFGSATGVTYSWTNSDPSIGLPANGTGDIASFVTTNTTTAPVVATITVTGSYTDGVSTCTGPPITFTITVRPATTVDAIADKTVCDGETVPAITFTGSDPLATYSWTNSNSSIGLVANGAGNINSFTATNSTNAPITSTITITPAGALAAGVPELLYYRFNGTGTSVPNEASAPPAGTTNATIIGGITQGAGLCTGSLIGTGGSSFNDYLNTNWATNLSGSWTISFRTENISASATTFYPFGDINAGQFRCFTNGVAGANNWMLRGIGMTDVVVNGGATVAPHMTTFVYDAPANVIRAYLDGVLVNTVAQPGALSFSGAGPFKVNGYGTNTSLPAGALLDEFRLYSRALTTTEVADLYNAGCNIATSCPAAPGSFTITVNPIPDAIATPSTQTICSGSNITPVVLTSTKTGTTYNWTRDNTGTVTGIAASGSGDITGALVNTTNAAVTVTFTITPMIGTCAGTPITATVVVDPALTVNTISNQIVCNNTSTVAVSFSGSNPAAIYNWTNNNPSIGLAANGTGNISSFTATNTGNTSQAASITVTPIKQTSEIFSYTGNMQTWTVPAGVTSITVDARGSKGGDCIYNQPGVKPDDLGGSGGRVIATYPVTPGQVLNIFVGGIPYNGGGTGAGSIAQAHGGGASDIRIGGTALTDRVIVAGGGGGGGNNCTPNPEPGGNGGGLIGETGWQCGSQTGGSVGLGGTQSAGGAAGTSPATPGVLGIGGNAGGAGTASGGGGGGYYGGGGAAYGGAGGGSSYTDPLATSVVHTQGFQNGTGEVIISYGTCTGAPQTFTITVNPTPDAAASTGLQTICSGSNITPVTISGSVSGTTFNWTRDNTATVTGINANGSGNISGSLVNTTNAPVTVTFTITPVANGCPGSPISTSVVVNPTATVTAIAPQTICSGATITTITPASPVTGSTFTWTRDNTATVTGIPASGNSDISGALTNTTNAPVTVTFTITPTANGCPGTPGTATIIVNPTPGAIATPASQTVCSGAITPIVFTGNVAGTTFNWTRDNTATVTGINASGSGDISGTLTNTTTSPVTVTFTITPVANGCPGTPITATVVVGAAPVIVCPANITVSNTTNTCGAAVTYTPTVAGIPAPDLTYSFSGATTGNGNGSGSGSTFNVGTTIVIITATNSCGSTNCSFTVTVNDTQVPTITCPAPLTVSCTSAVPAANTASVTATDNCPGVTVTHVGDVISNQTCPGRYTITRTYRATDAAGNTATCTQIITVNDQTAPVVTCPSNITATTAPSSCTAVVNFNVTATDNCSGTVTVVSTPASGSAFPVGVTTVTSTATDACGNTSTCTFTVTVTDAQASVITAQPVNDTVCVGENARFTVTATNAVSYQWQVNNGSGFTNIPGATLAALNVNNATLNMHNYQYRVIIQGPCSSVTSNVALLKVNELPTISITASPLTSLLPNQTTTLYAAFNHTPGSFAWYQNNNPYQVTTVPLLPDLTVDNLGSYYVIYTDNNGCSATSNTIAIQANPDFQFWVYPVPNDGRFTVRLYSGTLAVKRTLRVWNSAGALVFRKEFTMNSSYERMDVDINKYSAGVYLLDLIDASGKTLGASKVVVVK